MMDHSSYIYIKMITSGEQSSIKSFGTFCIRHKFITTQHFSKHLGSSADLQPSGKTGKQMPRDRVLKPHAALAIYSQRRVYYAFQLS